SNPRLLPWQGNALPLSYTRLFTMHVRAFCVDGICRVLLGESSTLCRKTTLFLISYENSRSGSVGSGQRVLLAHGRQQAVHLAAATLDNGVKIRALGQRHADVFNDDVHDFHLPVLFAQAPFNIDGGAVLLQDLAGDDRVL